MSKRAHTHPTRIQQAPTDDHRERDDAWDQSKTGRQWPLVVHRQVVRRHIQQSACQNGGCKNRSAFTRNDAGHRGRTNNPDQHQNQRCHIRGQNNCLRSCEQGSESVPRGRIENVSATVEVRKTTEG